MEQLNKNHITFWPKNVKPPEPVTLKKKLEKKVFSGDMYDFIELEPTPEAYQREGYDMEHCLSYLYDEYSQFARDKKIIVYSMIDVIGIPQLDIELALTEGCGVKIKVDKPTVMQIRGVRNQCPPADYLLDDLFLFLNNYGKDWIIEHNYPNFDGKCDGRVVTKYFKEYNG
jgi:hypothetical protein